MIVVLNADRSLRVMLRKTLTIFSLIGLLLSVGLWGVSYFRIGYRTPPPQNHTIMLAGGTIVHYQSLRWHLETI